MSTLTIFVWNHEAQGPARVVHVPGLTHESLRKGAAWLERIDGKLQRVRAVYRDDLDGVPVLTELERRPCSGEEDYPFVGEAVPLAEYLRRRPRRPHG